MRMTKRKKLIIEWLSCDDMDTIAARHFEYGNNGIGAMSMAAHGQHDLDINQSQLRSLYSTLQGMVKDGLLVCTYQTQKTYGGTFHRVTNWHIADRLEIDAQIMAQLDRMTLKKPTTNPLPSAACKSSRFSILITILPNQKRLVSHSSRTRNNPNNE